MSEVPFSGRGMVLYRHVAPIVAPYVAFEKLSGRPLHHRVSHTNQHGEKMPGGRSLMNTDSIELQIWLIFVTLNRAVFAVYLGSFSHEVTVINS